MISTVGREFRSDNNPFPSFEDLDFHFKPIKDCGMGTQTFIQQRRIR